MLRKERHSSIDDGSEGWLGFVGRAFMAVWLAATGSAGWSGSSRLAVALLSMEREGIAEGGEDICSEVEELGAAGDKLRARCPGPS
jgi:hypothetical protein